MQKSIHNLALKTFALSYACTYDYRTVVIYNIKLSQGHDMQEICILLLKKTEKSLVTHISTY